MSALLSAMQIAIVLGVAASAAGVVATRDPKSQAIAISFYGLLLALMFFVYQAPDVALSQIVIGAVALPLMVLLALAKIRRARERREEAERASRPSGSGGARPEEAAQ